MVAVVMEAGSASLSLLSQLTVSTLSSLQPFKNASLFTFVSQRMRESAWRSVCGDPGGKGVILIALFCWVSLQHNNMGPFLHIICVCAVSR